MMYKDLYLSLPGTLHAKGARRTTCAVGLFWANPRPSEISLTVATGDSHETWTVARSLFIAAHRDWYQGAWAGGGQFGICYAGPRLMLAFRPVWTDAHAVVTIAAPDSVNEFIEHTRGLVQAGDEETAVNLKAVDEALERILS